MRKPKDSIRGASYLTTTESISEEKMLDLENKPNFERAKEESELPVRNITFYQYEEVISELDNIKDELDKLKLNIASVLEEKTLAENHIRASSSKVLSYASSMRTLRKEIREVKEEKILKELARVEAMKEFEAIEAQREEEFNRFSLTLENTKRKMKQILEEIDKAKQMESELLATIDDVGVLQISLEMAKASEKNIRRSVSFHKGKELESINNELVSAKKELETIQGEAIQYMASMDIIRIELIRVCNETAKLKKVEKRNETRVQDLNSKILRANDKLKTVSKEEEKSRSIVSNLTLDLVHLKTETEASKKEKELIREEIKKMEALIQKTDSEIELGGGRLDEAIQELESVKLSESRALEDLKDLIESTMGSRANISEQNSSIKISKFEYEYLTERAIGAEVIADKKVAAAQAWIEALKASEREILMKIEIEHRRNEEREGKKAENKMISKTKSAIWNQVSGNSTPVRKARHRKSISLAARSMSRGSMTMRRKKNGSSPLVTLFDNQSIDTDL